jgi:hypothetical protein
MTTTTPNTAATQTARIGASVRRVAGAEDTAPAGETAFTRLSVRHPQCETSAETRTQDRPPMPACWS